jgi:hypothetical protein
MQDDLDQFIQHAYEYEYEYECKTIPYTSRSAALLLLCLFCLLVAKQSSVVKKFLNLQVQRLDLDFFFGYVLDLERRV